MEAVAAIGARRRFIEALAPVFGRPVEADSVSFVEKFIIFSLVSCVFLALEHFLINPSIRFFAGKHRFLLAQGFSHFWYDMEIFKFLTHISGAVHFEQILRCKTQ